MSKASGPIDLEWRSDELTIRSSPALVRDFRNHAFDDSRRTTIRVALRIDAPSP